MGPRPGPISFRSRQLVAIACEAENHNTEQEKNCMWPRSSTSMYHETATSIQKITPSKYIRPSCTEGPARKEAFSRKPHSGVDENLPPPGGDLPPTQKGGAFQQTVILETTLKGYLTKRILVFFLLHKYTISHRISLASFTFFHRAILQVLLKRKDNRECVYRQSKFLRGES